MMDDFLKLLSKKAQEQKGPMHGPRMHAKASMAKELSDMLGGDLTDAIKGSNDSEIVKAGFTAPKDKAAEAADTLADVVKSKVAEESESEDEESEDDDEMAMHGSDEESEPEHGKESAESASPKELRKQIAELRQELENLKKR